MHSRLIQNLQSSQGDLEFLIPWPPPLGCCDSRHESSCPVEHCRDQTQSFTHARQTFHQLNFTPQTHLLDFFLFSETGTSEENRSGSTAKRNPRHVSHGPAEKLLERREQGLCVQVGVSMVRKRTALHLTMVSTKQQICMEI